MPYWRYFPRGFFNILRLSTRWSQAFSFFFCFHVASDSTIRLAVAITCYSVVDVFLSTHRATLHLSLCCFANRSSETLLTCYRHQLSGCCMYIANACVLFSILSWHQHEDLTEDFDFFFSLTPVGKLTNKETFFFSRLPIRMIRNPIVKSNFFLLFSSITESHWSHWSVLESTDWEKDEWVQCFPLCSVATLIISWVSFVIVFFCNGCR